MRKSPNLKVEQMEDGSYRVIRKTVKDVFEARGKTKEEALEHLIIVMAGALYDYENRN